MKKVLDSNEISEAALTDHKKIILQLIGALNQLEDQKYFLEIEKKAQEKDIRAIIFNWDLVRSNMEFKSKLSKMDTNKIKEEFMVMDEVRNMKREDIAILINLERIRAALLAKNNI